MPIEFRAMAVGPLQTNCYLVWDSATSDAAIIDPGGNVEDIASLVSDLGVQVTWILLTHGHFDHTFHAADLAERYAAKVAMHEADIPILVDGMDIAAMFYDLSSYIGLTSTDCLADGQTVKLGESELRVVHTPGHSPGGLCFVSGSDVFCGDTIFAASIGRTDFTGGSYPQLIDSIKTRILTMDDSVALHPGHGGSTTVGLERASNPYLR